MTFTAFVFPKLRTPKMWFDNCLKSLVLEDSPILRFRGCFENQYRKRARVLLKSASQRLYHIHWLLTTTLWSKKSLLLTCQILAHLLNTLAADEKYPPLNRDNLTIPIQMHLSEKQITIPQFLVVFLKSTLNLEHFEKKDDPQSFCISDITDSENVVI